MTQSFQLNMKAGPNPGQVFVLDRASLSIGRETTNDIVISDADVSRKHAQLTLEGEHYLLEDLGSTNGTFVNGERISGPVALKAGDVILLGDTVELLFEAPSFDSAATMLAAPPPPPVVEQAAPAAPEPKVEPVELPPPPVYAEPIPPAEPVAPPKKGSKTGIIIAVGCLVVLCLCVIVVAVAYFALSQGGYL